MGSLKKVEWTERKIQDKLRAYFFSPNSKKYEITNLYVYGWESDYLAITKSMIAHEVEIKISRSDFKNDTKNKIDKHNKQVYELAPTAKDVYSGEIETSEYASHELIENFDDDAISEEIENSTDSFDSEDSNVENSTKKHFWPRKNKTDKKQKIKKNITSCYWCFNE